MTRTFAYRCGGSDGIALIWLTVFPFNPLTEQSEGHLQTRDAGWFNGGCLSSYLQTAVPDKRQCHPREGGDPRFRGDDIANS